MADNTPSAGPQLTDIILLLNERFDAHNRQDDERDKNQRTQWNIMAGKIDAFIHETACKDVEHKTALDLAIKERRKDFAEYKEEVNIKLDDMKGDVSVINTRVDVLYNAGDRKIAARVKGFWSKFLTWILTFLGGVILTYILVKLKFKP